MTRALRIAGVAVLCAGLAAPVFAQQSSGTAGVPDFEVEGLGFTSCQCPAYGCPCRSNGHPTHGTCEAADFAYIRTGHFGDVRLDGIRFVTVGNLVDANGEEIYGTLYVDQAASPEQQEAIRALVNTLAGPWYTHKLRVVSVPIRFYESADHTIYWVEIPGVLTQLSVLKRDDSGQPVSTVPAMDPWGNTIHYADNIVFRYSDGEHRWDLSGRQSNLKFFHTTRQMYENGELLILHGDMSGTWTAKQKELLKKLNLSPQ